MKYLCNISISVLPLFSFLFGSTPPAVPKSIYDFVVPALNGDSIRFSEFRGRKILIVNTASKCANTPQYAALQQLSETYKNKLVVVGFPSNNFFFEEPGPNKRIADFCRLNYGVTFPMAAKISVRGRNMAPIYRWLTQKSYNGYADNRVKWNFQKYLVDETGRLAAIFPPGMQPDSPEVITAIEK